MRKRLAAAKAKSKKSGAAAAALAEAQARAKKKGKGKDTGHYNQVSRASDMSTRYRSSRVSVHVIL